MHSIYLKNSIKVFVSHSSHFVPDYPKGRDFSIFKKNLVLYLLYVSFLDLDRCSILFAPLDKVCTTRRSVAYFMTLIKLGTPANPHSNSRLLYTTTIDNLISSDRSSLCYSVPLLTRRPLLTFLHFCHI